MYTQGERKYRCDRPIVDAGASKLVNEKWNELFFFGRSEDNLLQDIFNSQFFKNRLYDSIRNCRNRNCCACNRLVDCPRIILALCHVCPISFCCTPAKPAALVLLKYGERSHDHQTMRHKFRRRRNSFPIGLLWSRWCVCVCLSKQ